MTTDTDGYHKDKKFKRNILNHFLRLKVIPQKTKLNIECRSLMEVINFH